MRTSRLLWFGIVVTLGVLPGFAALSFPVDEGKDGKPISAGVFNPEGGRTDHWMMKLPQGIAAKEFAVSLEPAGGMPQPTGPMVLIGRA